MSAFLLHDSLQMKIVIGLLPQVIRSPTCMKFHSDLICEWDSPCGHLLCYGRFNMSIFVQAIFYSKIQLRFVVFKLNINH